MQKTWLACDRDVIDFKSKCTFHSGLLPIIRNYLLGGLSQRLGSISRYDKASLYYPKHSCAGGYFISHGILVRCQAFPSCLSLLKMLVCIQSHQTQCLDCDVGGDWFKWLM